MPTKKTGSGSKTSNKKKHSTKKINKTVDKLICEKIDEDFSKGKYGDIEIIIHNESRYINVSAIFKIAKKKFKDWYKTQTAKELIEAFSEELNITQDELMFQITTGPNETRGTYMHSYIIPYAIAATSRKLAAKISKIVNEYFANKNEEEMRAKDKLIKKKDDKIDRMSIKIDKLLVTNKKMNKNLKNLVDQADELYEKNDEIIYKLETVSNDRVVHTKKKGDRNVFVIIKNNYGEDDESDDEMDDSDEELVIGSKTKYEYYTIRTMC